MTKWLGIAAQLYVLFNVIFFISNVSTIILIRGFAWLTPDALLQIFARGAMICIGFTVAGCIVMAFVLRSLRKPQVR